LEVTVLHFKLLLESLVSCRAKCIKK
jgi:hypothetical protein